MHSHPLAMTRTIYDPALKNFVFNSPEGNDMQNIRQWIDNKNPVIYWYILRIDNPSELMLDQWAVELYTHQAISITDAYIDGINHRFELKKREHDPWSDKYVLSISRQLGIPIVGNGTQCIFFTVDVNCHEGLMYEYGISGRFIATGVQAINVREKTFCYSCKVGEFRQIFDNNPDEASFYAEKRLSTRYSVSSVQFFTNSFRMIHDLSSYCHFYSKDRGELLQKLGLLRSNFEKVPEIANKRIIPHLDSSTKILSTLDTADIGDFKSWYLRLCDSLVELLHLEVVISNESYDTFPENHKLENLKGDIKTENMQLKCTFCMNQIDSSNSSLLCVECGAQLCEICERWFRDERKRGERPLCKKCFIDEQKLLEKQKEERIRKEDKEQELLKKQKEGKSISAAYNEFMSKLSQSKNNQNPQVEKQNHTNSIGIEFVKIPSGEFMMGSLLDKRDNEVPIHKVTIKEPFYLGKFEVTQKQWEVVMGSNPSNFKSDDLPVENVSWFKVQEFIKKLNQIEGTVKYRIPSESEWEYTCRAGTTTRYCFGDDESKLCDHAWYSGNSGFETHPVGQKKPNPWGLYDMHGNVWEWCQDKFYDNYNGAPSDGSALEIGSSSRRVVRGGGWAEGAEHCRSAYRFWVGPGDNNSRLGFRVLMKL